MYRLKLARYDKRVDDKAGDRSSSRIYHAFSRWDCGETSETASVCATGEIE